ncbi:sorting nexin-20-like [Babylonia areolata]|uniref:sorting nexin-20-like n=1 Tax=Babylonia areolata TaxID=304850 RepID=UPI003FD127D7
MDAFMKKVRHKHVPFDDKCDAEVDDSELALEDDQDDPFQTPGFAGKLTFAGGDCGIAKDITDEDRDMLQYPVPYEGSQRDTCRVTFEVTSAEVIKEMRSSSVLPGSSSHVDYTIMISSSSGLKDIATCIVRRYSDFEQMHKLLKKRFPKDLSGVVFPQKVFVGNFTSETIARRSRAFEQYLTHLYSLLEVRYSSEFTKFFTGDDYSQAMQSFIEGKYFQAITSLERYVPVMEKLYGSAHKRLAQAVCALVVCHNKMNRPDVADTYATLAMDGLPESVLTVPLLQMLSQIRWSLGRDKQDVEGKLQELKEGGADVDSAVELEALLYQQLQVDTP